MCPSSCGARTGSLVLILSSGLDSGENPCLFQAGRRDRDLVPVCMQKLLPPQALLQCGDKAVARLKRAKVATAGEGLLPVMTSTLKPAKFQNPEGRCQAGAKAHLSEAADSEEALHGAGALISVDGAELRPAQGQVPVAVVAVLVDLHMEGAVHGLQLVGLPFDLGPMQM